MKTLLIILLLAANHSSISALDCSQKIKQSYEKYLSSMGHQLEYISLHPVSTQEMNEAWDNFEITSDNKNYMVFQGTSSFYGGYSIDAIVVEPNSGKIIDIQNVYIE